MGRAQSFSFSTLAGVGPGSSDGTATNARFFYPKGGALDAAGNLYIADSGNHTIRKITSAGVATTFAGLAGVSGSADGTNSTARFNNPSDILIDVDGTLYVADTGNHTIRQITPAGVVTTLAGKAGNYGTADGTNGNARFAHPTGLALDTNTGNIYVADSDNHVIRKLRDDPRNDDWIVTTLAGQPGVFGESDGNGSSAYFHNPTDVAVDVVGNVYVADANNSAIRKITPLAEVSTFAGSVGISGYSDGTNSDARFVHPSGMTIDSAGNLFVTDGGGYTIRKITPGAVVSTIAGKAGIPGNRNDSGTEALFNLPAGVTVDGASNLYIADSGSCVIRMVTPAGLVTTLAGLAVAPNGSVNGTNIAARLATPMGLATDAAGNIYVADTGSNVIRKITPAGAVTTLAGLAGVNGSADGTNGTARFFRPAGVAVDTNGNVYVADSLNHTIRKITPAGVVTTLAGLALAPGHVDDTNSAARFTTPMGVAVDADGNVYVADHGNAVIRKITPAGAVSTIAGLSRVIGSADGTNTAARFAMPSSIAVDGASNLYVADTWNHTIRLITPDGMVNTLAGVAGIEGSDDGLGTNALFNQPHGLALDGASNLFVADTMNWVIRKIAPGGEVSTVAALPGSFGVADDISPNAQFNYPYGVAADTNGNIYVADAFNNSIRKGAPYQPPFIAGELENQFVIGGDSVTFSANITGAGPLSYQWRKNGVDIAGKTNATLVLNNAGSNDNAGYDLVVTGSFGSVTSTVAALVVTVPPNDLFVNAIVLSGTNFTTTGSSVGAGKQGSEPDHAGSDGGRSVWWRWTAPADGTMTLDTSGSSFDTLLGVYTGTSVSALTPIVGNDDWSNSLSSLVVFGAKSGKTYRIAVDGYNGASGSIQLNMSWSPPVPPSIVAHPIPHIDIPGADVAFTASASGSAPIFYQWRKNGTNISGATSSTLILANIGTGSAANYTVVVTNEFGSVTSSNASLTLTNGLTFTTLAGTPGYGSADGIGSDARFHHPNDIAVDTLGNTYVVDSENHTVRKIAPGGVVTTLAGLAGVSGTADGAGNSARFNSPAGINLDAFGNIILADAGSHTIRQITPSGVVTTIAGLANNPGSADGTNNTARFFHPSGVSTDSSNNLIIADSGNHLIRRIAPGAVVTTIAGIAGINGSEDGTITNALFNFPESVGLDSSNNIYVADTFNSAIRKITPLGEVTTLAGKAGFPGSVDDISGTNARFNRPEGLFSDSNGVVYVADTLNHTIRKIAPDGEVTTFAGLSQISGSLDGTNGRFSGPTGVSLDSFGNVFVADSENNTVRVISAGVTSTLAGTSGIGTADGPGPNARFNYPAGIAVDAGGNAYVSDIENQTIRKITSGGVVTTFAGFVELEGSADGSTTNARFRRPGGVAVDLTSNVYVADTFNHTIRKITPAGLVSTVAGLAGVAGYMDGSSNNARFFYPQSVAVDSTGNIYVADTENYVVRKITPAGDVSTYAGNAGSYGNADGASSNALFSVLRGIAVDGAGNVYVADTGNHNIRKISSGGIVTTIAGLAVFNGSVGSTGNQARFDFPQGVAVDNAGNVYVADTGNHTLRLITPSGLVRTLGGSAGFLGATDGTGANAGFFSPQSVAVDAAGNVYVADSGNYSVRKGGVPVPVGPTLQIGIASGQLVLSWPTNATGYIVEISSNSVPTGIWLPATNTVGTVGTNFVITNAVTPGSTFYRLRKP